MFRAPINTLYFEVPHQDSDDIVAQRPVLLFGKLQDSVLDSWIYFKGKCFFHTYNYTKIYSKVKDKNSSTILLSISKYIYYK